MKLTFTPPQLAYLDERMSQLVLAARSNAVDEATRRTVRKMKTKFAPGASTYVWLSQKERSLLFSMLNYRMNTLMSSASASEELDTVGSLLDTLADERPKGESQ